MKEINDNSVAQSYIATRTLMKLNALWLILVLTASVIAAESLVVIGNVANSYDVVQAPVLRVYGAKDGEHRFTAYVVKWKNSEVIVSDPLAGSDHKVGDTISFLAQKISTGDKASTAVHVLSFTLGRPEQK